MSLPARSIATPVVYLIDDDPNDVLLIRRLCESVGLVVESFESPQEFLRQVQAENHGCIVADLMMPEMTGLELHAELQKSETQMPIIVVTGHADARTCRSALQSGVFDFIEKSFNPHDLLVVIRAAINRDASQNDARTRRHIAMEQLRDLSKREREVMQLLVDGLALKEIATELTISVQTASKHRSKLFEKLNVHNEVELLKLLLRIDPTFALQVSTTTNSFPVTTCESLLVAPVPAI